MEVIITSHAVERAWERIGHIYFWEHGDGEKGFEEWLLSMVLNAMDNGKAADVEDEQDGLHIYHNGITWLFRWERGLPALVTVWGGAAKRWRKRQKRIQEGA